jgi:hypothetical protein
MLESTRNVLSVSLEGFTMRLRPSELEPVASGYVAAFGPAPRTGATFSFAAALHGLPQRDRASTWELAVRHFGRRKALVQAAAEIGMDALHAEHLLQRYREQLTALPAD